MTHMQTKIYILSQIRNLNRVHFQFYSHVQTQTRTLGAERAHEASTLPLENDGLEEPPSQLCPQPPVDNMAAESVGMSLTTSTMSPDSPNREQYRSALTLREREWYGRICDRDIERSDTWLFIDLTVRILLTLESTIA